MISETLSSDWVNLHFQMIKQQQCLALLIHFIDRPSINSTLIRFQFWIVKIKIIQIMNESKNVLSVIPLTVLPSLEPSRRFESPDTVSTKCWLVTWERHQIKLITTKESWLYWPQDSLKPLSYWTKEQPERERDILWTVPWCPSTSLKPPQHSDPSN